MTQMFGIDWRARLAAAGIEDELLESDIRRVMREAEKRKNETAAAFGVRGEAAAMDIAKAMQRCADRHGLDFETTVDKITNQKRGGAVHLSDGTVVH